MSNLKHTPGPWQVVTNKHEHLHGGSHTERRIFTEWAHGQLKAPFPVVNSSVVFSGKECAQQPFIIAISEADASLIAAAPDLLEALKTLATGLQWNIENHPEVMNESDNEALEMAKTAIAKATGEL